MMDPQSFSEAARWPYRLGTVPRLHRTTFPKSYLPRIKGCVSQRPSEIDETGLEFQLMLKSGSLFWLRGACNPTIKPTEAP